MHSKKFFPGWLIVVGGFLIMATCYAVFVNCFNLFLVPITQDLGIARAQFNANSSIAALVGVLASLVVGKLVDKHSARSIGVFCVLITVIVMVCWAFVTQLWQMYLLSLVIGFSVVSGTRLLISILVANWFDHKRGLAISIALSGSGVGGAVMSQIVSAMIAAHGWRPTFLILAVITFLCSMPLTATIFRNNPSDTGLKSYGASDEEEKGADQKRTDQTVTGVDQSVAVRSNAFWMLMIGFLLMGLINGGVIMNMSANFIDAGHTTAFATNIVSMQMLVLIIAKIALGALYDRFGLTTATMVGSITTILATVSLLFGHTMIAPYLFALFFGFGTCLGTVAPPLMVINEFGKRSLGTLVGYVTAIEMLGVAIGALMLGAIYDATGAYALGWMILSVLGAVMTVTLILSIGMSKKLVAGLQAISDSLE
ncbi:MFS transporter [Sporolactobacillus shoreicorticis]|uniref:MFS transporter n=1 Tax=Sporolactobacillus shoreicorticis TaxID=1923877 RepID=A0ABW5S4M2_9BACL|nr:MFS transporter [Sporolactobacillus shoreicorticis]MCO7125333.1 MFS transporter [Sporolactobacillus shoreicorticis]